MSLASAPATGTGRSLWRAVFPHPGKPSYWQKPQRSGHRPGSAYGRLYGFERMMDNLGAIFGPLLALGLLAWLGVQWAIGLSVIPGPLAAAAIVYAIRRA
jgi:MFS family permease